MGYQLTKQEILKEVIKSGLIFTVEENPRLCGWGAEIASLIMEHCFKFSYITSPISIITK